MKDKVFVAIQLEIDGEVQQFSVPADAFKKTIESLSIDKDTEVIQLAFDINGKTISFPLKLSDAWKMIKSAELYKSIIPKKLNGYLTDVTQKLINSKKAPLVGRDEEIKKAWNFLSQDKRNNVIFTGEVEVGKTAIATELIRQIATNECPKSFYNKRVLKFNPNFLLREIESSESKRQAKYIKTTIEELYEFFKQYRNEIVIYIDDAIFMKTDEYLMDILNRLVKIYNIPMIMATTYDNYEYYFLNDFIISKFINEIYVEEPVYDDIEPMLRNFIKNYQKKN